MPITPMTTLPLFIGSNLAQSDRTLFARGQGQGINQPVNLKGFRAGDDGLASIADGLKKVALVRCVPVMGKGHRIGPAACSSLFSKGLRATIVVGDGEDPGAKMSRRLFKAQFDGFRSAGISSGGRDDGTQRTGLKA